MGKDKGKWGVAVVACSHLVQVLSIGVGTSLGVFLNEWAYDFNISVGSAGLVIIIVPLIGGFLSPLAAALIGRYGCRPVAFFGSIIWVVAVFSSCFVTSFVQLLLLFGVTQAIGVAMMYFSAIVILGVYFEKRLVLANSLSFVGISTGQLIAPPLMRFLIDSYGWRGSLLIMSAILMNLFISAAVFRPMHSERVARRPKTNSSYGGLENDFDNVEVHQTGDSCDRENPDRDNGNSGHENGNPGCENGNSDRVARRPTTKSSQYDGLENDLDIVNRENPDHKNGNPDICSNNIDIQPKTSDWKMLGASTLCVNPHFLSTLFTLNIIAMSLMGTVVFIIPQAEAKGIPKDLAALLITSLGVGGFIGRLGHGIAIDRHYITMPNIFMLGMITSALTTILLPIFDIYGVLVTLVIFLGASNGIITSLCLTVIPKQVVSSTPDLVRPALGFAMLVAALGQFIGGLIAVVVFNSTGTYSATYYALGGLVAVTTLIYIPTYRTLQNNSASQQRSHLA